MTENQDAPSSIRVFRKLRVMHLEMNPNPMIPQVNESMWTGTKKRKREADNSVEQKGKAPNKQTSGNEASTSRQQPKQKETKDEGNRMKNTHFKFARLKKAIWKFCFGRTRWPFLSRYKLLPPSMPMHPDLQEILKKMEDIRAKSDNDVTLDELNRELDSLGKQ
ncbi:hypothetical protein GOBAR_DD09873 [Gossypium barbadense]|nr:hypothetical protein GOBAR_DD09873 [Gossypium barbadense]